MNKTDAIAVSLSTLCLMHCLAVPVMASALPLMGMVSEAEWLHQLVVLMTLPLAAGAYFTSQAPQIRLRFGLMACPGALCLLLGAFIEPLHDFEILLTVCGALLLGGAHLYRWKNHSLY